MARPKVEINTIRCERLSLACKEHGISQKRLSELTGISQQAISNMVRGKANVTEETAKVINKVYPQYSVEWLMGYSDCRNHFTEAVSELDSLRKKEWLLASSLAELAKRAGYEIEITFPKKDRLPSITVDEAKNSFLTDFRDGYILKNDEASVQLTMSEMKVFEEEVVECVGMMVKHLMKRKGGNNG